MGQAEVAIIAVACFALGIVARHAWPLFVAWQDQKLLKAKPQTGWNGSPARTIYPGSGYVPTAEAVTQPPPPRRRIGLAEMRARKEAESYKPVERQAQVTANNIAALEGK